VLNGATVATFVASASTRQYAAMVATTKSLCSEWRWNDSSWVRLVY